MVLALVDKMVVEKADWKVSSTVVGSVGYLAVS